MDKLLAPYFRAAMRSLLTPTARLLRCLALLFLPLPSRRVAPDGRRDALSEWLLGQ